MKPFRFAAGIRHTSTRVEFVNEVREVERLGYSALMLSDHLVDQFAPISALGAAATCAIQWCSPRSWPRWTG